MKTILPNFLIIGAMRSGTTSLYHYLRQHPDIFLPDQKELNFFTFPNSFSTDLSNYSQYFQKWSGQKAIGEASPHYMYYSHIIPSISKKLPKIKLISILRNPIDRTYSHYWYSVRRGREWLSFYKALRAEEMRLEKYKKYFMVQPSWFYWYKDMSKYDIQISRVLDYFDKNQLMVISLEELVSDYSTTLKKICTFLKVDNSFQFQKNTNLNQISNSARLPRNILLMRILAYFREKFIDAKFLWRLRESIDDYQKKMLLTTPNSLPPIRNYVRSYLHAELSPHVRNLSKLIDIDFSGWEII